MPRQDYLSPSEIRIELIEALREGKNPFNSASQTTVKTRVIKNTDKALRSTDWEEVVAQAIAVGEIERVPNAPARIRLTQKGQSATKPRQRLTVPQLQAEVLKVLRASDPLSRKNLLTKVRGNNPGKTVNSSDFGQACNEERAHGRIQVNSSGMFCAIR